MSEVVEAPALQAWPRANLISLLEEARSDYCPHHGIICPEYEHCDYCKLGRQIDSALEGERRA